MGQIIKDENKKGCNFQKASCTLDASIKIYSHRVDDTWAGSLRILENLSRNGGGNGDYDEDGDDRDDEETDASKPHRVAKVGSKSTSARLGLTNTIEKNPKTLNMARVEGESTTDPMFQKMSMAFDEGGAKGMLMNNLRVSPDSCSMVFSSIAPSSETEAKASTVNASSHSSTVVSNNALRDLLTRLNVTPVSLANSTICPGLAEYRSNIGMNAGVLNAFTPLPDPTLANLSAPDSERMEYPSSSAALAPESIAEEDTYSGGDDYGGDDDDNEYGGGDNDGEDMDTDMPAADNSASASVSAPGTSKWAQLFGGAPLDGSATPASAGSSANNSPTKQQQLVERTAHSLEWNSLGVSNANDYSFFNMNSLVNGSGADGNKWAGSRHWKFATRKARAPLSETTDGVNLEANTVVVAKPRTLKAKSVLFNFSDNTPLDQALFAAPVVTKRKANSTVFSDAVLAKQATEAANGAYKLPEDSKIQLQDLCRLFLRPNMIAPPANMLPFFQPRSGSGDKAAGSKYSLSGSLSGKDDLIWGVLANKESTVLESVSVEHVVDTDHYMTESGDILYNGHDDGGDDDDNEHYGGGDYDDNNNDDDNNHADDVVASLTSSLATGLQINSSKLVQAARTVGKVNVGYATSAKLVNVRKLKTDLWSAIEHSAEYQAPPTKVVDENKENMSGRDRRNAAGAVTADKYETLSFQNVVKGVATAPATKQKDASLSFYFISLLHLANEKNLCITGNAMMNDLRISK